MNIPPEVLIAIAVLSIVLGSVECFFGFRLFKIVLALTGFIVGGGLAGWVVYASMNDYGPAIVAGLAAGLLGAVLVTVLFVVGVFLSGALVGGLIGAAPYLITHHDPQIAVIVTLALLGGVAAIFMQRLMLIVSTSFSGSLGVVGGILYFATGGLRHLGGDTWLIVSFLGWIVLGIAGVFVQYIFAPVKEKPPSLPPGAQNPAAKTVA